MPKNASRPGRNHASDEDFNLIVVGTGPVAAVAVREYLDARPGSTVAMIDAGPPLSKQPGEHLISTDPQRLDNTYLRLMDAARQIASTPEPSPRQHFQDVANRDVAPDGLLPAAFAGHDMQEFPGAVMARNVGGMGVHWVAACPWPDGPELIPGIAPAAWHEQLTTAQRHLRTTPHGYPDNPFSKAIIAALDEAVPSPDPHRRAQPMPMAVIRDPLSGARRTGPLDVLPEMDPAHGTPVTLLHSTLCTRILTNQDRATGVLIRDTSGGPEQPLRARTVIVAADTLRTPQLLFVSGLGGPALGRYLNEHACLSIQVPVDRDRLTMSGQPSPQARPGEPFIGTYWIPSRGPAQPIHIQLMETVRSEGHLMRITAYAPTQVRPDNRIAFSRVETDHVGLPRIRAHFSYSGTDHAMIATARRSLTTVVSAIAKIAPGHTTRVPVAPAGSSLHYTGTARIGPANDGTSVCDTAGRVWGLRNLFVVGNATIPTALTCNSTLASAAVAVAAGRTAATV